MICWIGSADPVDDLCLTNQIYSALLNAFEFKSLRNRVNRLRKSCRAKYYESKEEHLMNCKPRTWWKEVKTLGGMKSATRTDPLSVLTHVQPC